MTAVIAWLGAGAWSDAEYDGSRIIAVAVDLAGRRDDGGRQGSRVFGVLLDEGGQLVMLDDVEASDTRSARFSPSAGRRWSLKRDDSSLSLSKCCGACPNG